MYLSGLIAGQGREFSQSARMVLCHRELFIKKRHGQLRPPFASERKNNSARWLLSHFATTGYTLHEWLPAIQAPHRGDLNSLVKLIMDFFHPSEVCGISVHG
jgi:hypothetical protein